MNHFSNFRRFVGYESRRTGVVVELINWVCEPLAELRSMGLIFSSHPRVPDIFLKGERGGAAHPVRGLDAL